MGLKEHRRTQVTLFEPEVDVEPKLASSTFALIKELGRVMLGDTHLVCKGEIETNDVEALMRFLAACSLINPAVFNQNTQQHLLLTSRYARLIGQKLGYDNLHLLEALGLLHDLGRVFSHRRGRNSRIADLLFKSIGIREDILDLLPTSEKKFSTGSFLPNPDSILNISDLTEMPERAMVEIADVLGKPPMAKGKLRRWRQVVNDERKGITQKPPDQDRMWPSEFKRQTKVGDLLNEAAQRYENLGNWLKEEGINSDQLVEEMMSRLQSDPLAASFLEKLGLSMPKVVIFDVGGVLEFGEHTSDSHTAINKLIEVYQLSEPDRRRVEVAFSRVSKLLQLGQIDLTTAKETLDKKIGKKAEYDLEIVLSQESHIDLRMIAIVQALKAQGVRVIIASNTIVSHWKRTSELLSAAGLNFVLIENSKLDMEKQVQQAEVRGATPYFTSCESGERKGSGSRFFQTIIGTMQITNPNEILVIDDKPEYCQEAITTGAQAHCFRDPVGLLVLLVGYANKMEKVLKNTKV